MHQQKPLRISGDPQKVEHAKSLVFELIQDKEQFRGGGASGGEQAEVFVPKIAVGVVIGKGGDMIKKIQGETGCKLQFIQGKNDGPGDRRCIIQGTRQQVDEAKRMIEELIDSVMVTYCIGLENSIIHFSIHREIIPGRGNKINKAVAQWTMAILPTVTVTA